MPPWEPLGSTLRPGSMCWHSPVAMKLQRPLQSLYVKTINDLHTVIYCLLIVIYCLLMVIYCLFIVIYCLLMVIYYLLIVIWYIYVMITADLMSILIGWRFIAIVTTESPFWLLLTAASGLHYFIPQEWFLLWYFYFLSFGHVTEELKVERNSRMIRAHVFSSFFYFRRFYDLKRWSTSVPTALMLIWRPTGFEVATDGVSFWGSWSFQHSSEVLTSENNIQTQTN